MSSTPSGVGVGEGDPGVGPKVGAGVSCELPLHVGTWNVSWWSQARFPSVESLGVHLIALQETKLASLPLERARGSLRGLGYTLHHGMACPVRRAGGHGDSGGVGVLAAPGVAISPLAPSSPAWRRLHAMARLHGALVPPRRELPLGLRVFSVYAPLPRDPGREIFNSTFLEFVAGLDMQIPTLLLGDFNGTTTPERDHSCGGGPVCPLLSRLLGPGGSFIDLQLAVSPEEWAYTFSMPQGAPWGSPGVTSPWATGLYLGRCRQFGWPRATWNMGIRLWC